MKKMFFVAALLFSIIMVHGQSNQLPFDLVTHTLTYTEEVPVPGRNAQELYDKIKSVVFRGYDKVKYNRFWGDPNTLIIYVNGGFLYYINSGQFGRTERYVNFEWKVECRDGSYKYTMTNFNDGIEQTNWTVPVETPDMTSKQKRKVHKTLKSMAWVDKEARRVIGEMKEGI